jgi:hypothetical protein
MIRRGMNRLTLAIAPISNQEAEWLWKDGEIRSLLSDSKVYMIGQRAELKFDNFRILPAHTMGFDLVCNGKRLKDVRLPLGQFNVPDEKALNVEVGEKCLRFLSAEPGCLELGEGGIVHWLTPDRMIWLYTRNELSVYGLEEFRMFTEFELYYVGLSKKHDSFSRLFKSAHEKRSRILGNESQMIPAARLTDELTIFMFNVTGSEMHQFEDSDFEDESNFDFSDAKLVPPDVLAADAEKAFVKVLKSKYNDEVYNAYPESKDGLWGSGFARYTYFINEPITLRTKTGTMRGARVYDDPYDHADVIIVEGDNVRVWRDAEK